MKKLLAIAMSLALLGAFAPVPIRAADADPGAKKRPKPTEEQRKLKKELLDKYDTNKDGKLDKNERAKVSKEDKDRLEKAGLGPHPKKGDDHDKKDAAK